MNHTTNHLSPLGFVIRVLTIRGMMMLILETGWRAVLGLCNRVRYYGWACPV